MRLGLEPVDRDEPEALGQGGAFALVGGQRQGAVGEVPDIVLTRELGRHDNRPANSVSRGTLATASPSCISAAATASLRDASFIVTLRDTTSVTAACPLGKASRKAPRRPPSVAISLPTCLPTTR